MPLGFLFEMTKDRGGKLGGRSGPREDNITLGGNKYTSRRHYAARLFYYSDRKPTPDEDFSQHVQLYTGKWEQGVEKKKKEEKEIKRHSEMISCGKT